MTFILLDRIKDRIDDAALARWGRSVGTDGSATPVVMSGALPGLLNALTGAAHRPGGARRLFADLTRKTPAAPAVSPDAAAGNAPVERLDAVIGSETRQRLGEALARFAGIDVHQASRALGLLLPTVMDALVERVRERRLDADGLAALLLEQRNAVDATMPAGFTEQLRALGYFRTVVDDAPSADTAATPAAPSGPAPDTPGTTPGTMPGGPRRVSRRTLAWVIALLVLLIATFAGMRFIGERAADRSDRSSGIVDQPADKRSAGLGHGPSQ